ncbi:MAG: MotA/TolQ/ExbB proton channel family protein [Kiritimatiellaeota bacterium]|nr:MotA/TolQ/ExbB proton channel family protein [Kiritimatiellota bacterium]
MTRHSIRILLCAGLLGAGIGFAQETGETPGDEIPAATFTAVDAEEAAPAGKEQTRLDVWIGYVKMGGLTMVFLGLLSVLGIAAALERAVNLRRARIVPDDLAMKAVDLWKNKKYAELSNLCGKDKSILGRVIETLLEQRGNHDVAQVKMFAEDKASRELRLESRRAGMLSIVATIAPLLGLFGTVVGLLGAFMTVAKVGDMGNPALLAEDIGKALITTVTGLIIAMPMLFLFHIFRSRVNLFAVLLEEEVSALVNAWFVKKG